jgi:hypothetical protein
VNELIVFTITIAHCIRGLVIETADYKLGEARLVSEHYDSRAWYTCVHAYRYVVLCALIATGIANNFGPSNGMK